MKHFFISGISSGLGQLLCQRALLEGHKVLAHARSVDSISATTLGQEFLKNENFNLWTTDLKTPLNAESKRELLQKLKSIENIDYVFHFAGYLEGGAWEDLDPSDLLAEFQVNVFNIHNITRILMPYFNPGAKVYTAGSVAGHFNYPIMGAYCASKAALRYMMNTWSYEATVKGFKFCNLCLGPIKTPFWLKSREQGNHLNSDYSNIEEALKDISYKIESLGHEPDYIINKIWSSLDKPKLKKEWVLVKYSLFNFYGLKLLPSSLYDFILKKLLKIH